MITKVKKNNQISNEYVLTHAEAFARLSNCQLTHTLTHSMQTHAQKQTKKETRKEEENRKELYVSYYVQCIHIELSIQRSGS